VHHIEGDHLVAGRSDRGDDVSADEAGRAGDQDSHVSTH
jgi:hypothetical protein